MLVVLVDGKAKKRLYPTDRHTLIGNDASLSQCVHDSISVSDSDVIHPLQSSESVEAQSIDDPKMEPTLAERHPRQDRARGEGGPGAPWSASIGERAESAVRH